MKDTVITAKAKKRELIVLAISFGVAFILNAVAITSYNTDWIELLSQLHIVLLLTVILYALYWLIRLIVVGIKRLTTKKSDKTTT